jgi:hypothetical protein
MDIGLFALVVYTTVFMVTIAVMLHVGIRRSGENAGVEEMVQDEAPREDVLEHQPLLVQEVLPQQNMSIQDPLQQRRYNLRPCKSQA